MQVSKVKTIIFKQYQLGVWVGAVRELFARVQYYYSVVQFILILAIAYHTTLRDWFSLYAPWVTLPIFAVIISLAVLLGMLLEYKFSYPASVTYSSHQWYKHNNPVREEFEQVHRELKQLRQELWSIRNGNVSVLQK